MRNLCTYIYLVIKIVLLHKTNNIRRHNPVFSNPDLKKYDANLYLKRIKDAYVQSTNKTDKIDDTLTRVNNMLNHKMIELNNCNIKNKYLAWMRILRAKKNIYAILRNQNLGLSYTNKLIELHKKSNSFGMPDYYASMMGMKSEAAKKSKQKEIK